MNKIDITKKIVRAIVTTSVSFTVSNALAANTPVTKTHQKVEVVIGSFVIGSMVGDRAGVYTDKKVDEFFEWFDTTFKKTSEQ